MGAQTIAEAGLRCLADVAMVQATDFGELHDPACREDLDRPEIGRVLVQREMGAHSMVVSAVAGQAAAEVSLVEDESMGFTQELPRKLLPTRAKERQRRRRERR